MASVHINASFANGTTLQQFGKIISERMKWMHETARDSIAACAITMLKSIRTVTKVAKLSSIKVDVKVDSSLYPSFNTQGGRRFVCVRFTGSDLRYMGKERVVACGNNVDPKSWFVFTFTDTLSPKLTKYLIIAPSLAEAKAKAKSIVRSRQIRFAGLAKRALGVLMMKVGTKNIQDGVPMRVTAKAKSLTQTKEVVAKAADNSGGKYALIMLDDLRYAIDAIKGGRAAVNTQLKKAMNKVVSVINKKIPDSGTFFGSKKLQTPFPELVRKRKK